MEIKINFGSSCDQTWICSTAWPWCSYWIEVNTTQILFWNSPHVAAHSFSRQNMFLSHSQSRLQHVLPSVTHGMWISANVRDTCDCGCWSHHPKKHKGWNSSEKEKKRKSVELVLPSGINVALITIIHRILEWWNHFGCKRPLRPSSPIINPAFSCHH